MLLRDLDKEVGTDRDTITVFPTRQRFGADDLAIDQIDDGLVEDLQRLFFDRATKLLLHGKMAAAESRKKKTDQRAGDAAEARRAGDRAKLRLPRFVHGGGCRDAGQQN